MAYWDIGMRHIVDVDGQLLAIDAEVIDTSSLLAKAGHSTDRQLCMVRAGESFALQPMQHVRLSKDEVLFFESTSARAFSAPQRMAA
jgi:hypothetical protein